MTCIKNHVGNGFFEYFTFFSPQLMQYVSQNHYKTFRGQTVQILKKSKTCLFSSKAPSNQYRRYAIVIPTVEQLLSQPNGERPQQQQVMSPVLQTEAHQKVRLS